MNDLTIRGAELPDGRRADLHIAGGIFRDEASAGAEVVDADGLLALPGLVDLHTHLREPGGELAETVLTGSRAAAAGGYTTVFAMANTSPVGDTAERVSHVARLGQAAGYVDVRPIGAVTVGLGGERIADLEAMAASPARVRVFSDDGVCVHDPALMRDALARAHAVGAVIAQHAQEPRLTVDAHANAGAAADALGVGGWPGVAEETIIARDVLLAEELGARVHICHLSTAGSVEVVRWAKARGIRVTAEATPHHLLLADDVVRGGDTRFKVNPPLRGAEDVEAVRAGVADGTIDIIATDHAPHPAASKAGSWRDAANGMVGLESALRVAHLSLVETGLLSWDGLAAAMSTRPAAVGGIGGYDRPFATGTAAHVVLYDPTPARPFTRDDLKGRSVNSPFLDTVLPGHIARTIAGGRTTALDGVPVADPR